MRQILRTTGLGLLLALAGCGRGDVTLAPVGGRVFYRGQPLAGGTIVFTPDSERGGTGPQGWAVIDPEGNYSLQTNDHPGAVPGWHRVTVATLPTVARPGQPAPVSLPTRYRDPELGGQCFEVKAGQVNSLDLHLE